MSLKNYYRILEIDYSATAEEVKKAYRRLALKYHPDKNPGDPLAEPRFKEIQEAYHTLSDTHRRSSYNQRRWFTRHSIRRKTTEPLSPSQLLIKSIELADYLMKLGDNRVNQKALFHYLSYLLSNATLKHLAATSEHEVKEKIILTLLPVTTKLRVKERITILKRLKAISVEGEELNLLLETTLKKNRLPAIWENYHHVFIMVLSILICWLIFLVSE